MYQTKNPHYTTVFALFVIYVTPPKAGRPSSSIALSIHLLLSNYKLKRVKQKQGNGSQVCCVVASHSHAILSASLHTSRKGAGDI